MVIISFSSHGVAWPSNTVQSVNEVEGGGPRWNGGHSQESLSVCERLLIVWRWNCSTHAGCGLWLNVTDVIVCLLVLTSGGRSKFLGEWTSLRNRMKVFAKMAGPSN